MNINEEKIRTLIYKALNNLNEELGEGQKIPIGIDTCLFGSNAVLDSLSLVSVIVDVETEVSSELGHSISLTDDRAMSSTVSPFTNVETLTSYILELLSEKV